MKKILLIFIYLLSIGILHSQDLDLDNRKYRNKRFVLDAAYPRIECTALGHVTKDSLSKEEYLPPGDLIFKVVNDSGKYWVIEYLNFINDDALYNTVLSVYKKNYQRDTIWIIKKDTTGKKHITIDKIVEINNLNFVDSIVKVKINPKDSADTSWTYTKKYTQIDPIKNKRHFLIKKIEFEGVTSEKLPTFSLTFGIPTLPVKMRFGNAGDSANHNPATKEPRYFKFEGNLSLGFSAGLRVGFNRLRTNSINFLFGFSISSVQIDSASTKGTVKAATNIASLSPHFGVVFEIQRIQFGIYTGLDFLTGEPNATWVYRNQPWLGIGIGYRLINFGVDQSNTNSGKK